MAIEVIDARDLVHLLPYEWLIKVLVDVSSRLDAAATSFFMQEHGPVIFPLLFCEMLFGISVIAFEFQRPMIALLILLHYLGRVHQLTVLALAHFHVNVGINVVTTVITFTTIDKYSLATRVRYSHTPVMVEFEALAIHLTTSNGLIGRRSTST